MAQYPLAPVAVAGLDSLPGFAPSVARIDLAEFRNYTALRLELAGRPVVLTGPNGAGKTNLLEALSFLSPGRGLRRARLGEVTRQGAPSRAWAVAVRLATSTGSVDLGTGLGAGNEDEGERRLVRVDGQPASGPAVLTDHLCLAWLTPQMDRLFIESAGGRRRFLDRLVYGFDPDHARRVAAFERAMRDRNRLLERGGDGEWLAAQEETMAEHAVAVAAARRDGVARLGAALRQSAGPFPRADIAVDGLLETWLDEMPASAVEDRYRAALAAGRPRDAAAGLTLEGPHRADFLVRHAAKDQAAEFCSTGEQKALLIAIVLANARLVAARRGIAPILLLDEVVAHLDQARRAALFDEICTLGAQAWLTGTDAALFAELRDRAEFFTVRDGTVAADLS